MSRKNKQRRALRPKTRTYTTGDIAHVGGVMFVRDEPVVHVTAQDYVDKARYWRSLGSTISPSERDVELGIFAVVEGVPYVYVG